MYNPKKRIATDFPNWEVFGLRLEHSVCDVSTGRVGKVTDRFNGVNSTLFTSCGEVLRSVLIWGTETCEG